MATKKESQTILLKSIDQMSQELDLAKQKFAELNEEQKKTIEAQEQFNEQLKLEIKLLESQIQLKEKRRESIEQEQEDLKKLNIGLKNQTKELEKQKELQKEISSLAKSFANEINGALGLVEDLRSNWSWSNFRIKKENRRIIYRT